VPRSKQQIDESILDGKVPDRFDDVEAFKQVRNCVSAFNCVSVGCRTETQHTATATSAEVVNTTSVQTTAPATPTTAKARRAPMTSEERHRRWVGFAPYLQVRVDAHWNAVTKLAAEDQTDICTAMNEAVRLHRTDNWGQPVTTYCLGDRLLYISAGFDQTFGTDDDLEFVHPPFPKSKRPSTPVSQ
jgi:CRISPR/Cas system type I-B associated protein Csh2 (Cas7 group RAMP superfamily)